MCENTPTVGQMLEVFESDAGELGPDLFREFSLPHLCAIAAKVKAALRAKGIDPVPMTVFPRGAFVWLGFVWLGFVWGSFGDWRIA